jgi:hypothetical protein
MVCSDETLENIFSRIRKEELTCLAMDLVNIASPTGEEGKLAEFIVDWLRKQDIPACLHQTEEDLVRAAKVYAAVAVDICSREKTQT